MPGGLVVYDQGGEWCLLMVVKVVRTGSHRRGDRRWLIYVAGSTTGYEESELKPYDEEEHAQIS